MASRALKYLIHDVEAKNSTTRSGYIYIYPVMHVYAVLDMFGGQIKGIVHPKI